MWSTAGDASNLVSGWFCRISRTLWLQPILVRTVDVMGDVVLVCFELATFPGVAKERWYMEIEEVQTPSAEGGLLLGVMSPATAGRFFAVLVVVFEVDIHSRAVGRTYLIELLIAFRNFKILVARLSLVLTSTRGRCGL